MKKKELKKKLSALQSQIEKQNDFYNEELELADSAIEQLHRRYAELYDHAIQANDAAQENAWVVDFWRDAWEITQARVDQATKALNGEPSSHAHGDEACCGEQHASHEGPRRTSRPSDQEHRTYRE
jgi:hypothetical protein